MARIRGAKDLKPRVRRTKAELDAAREHLYSPQPRVPVELEPGRRGYVRRDHEFQGEHLASLKAALDKRLRKGACFRCGSRERLGFWTDAQDAMPGIMAAAGKGRFLEAALGRASVLCARCGPRS